MMICQDKFEKLKRKYKGIKETKDESYDDVVKNYNNCLDILNDIFDGSNHIPDLDVSKPTSLYRCWDRKDKRMKPVYKLDFGEWMVSPDLMGKDAERNSFKNETTDRHLLMKRYRVGDTFFYDNDIIREDLNIYLIKNGKTYLIFNYSGEGEIGFVGNLDNIRRPGVLGNLFLNYNENPIPLEKIFELVPFSDGEIEELRDIVGRDKKDTISKYIKNEIDKNSEADKDNKNNSNIKIAEVTIKDSETGEILFKGKNKIK